MELFKQDEIPVVTLCNYKLKCVYSSAPSEVGQYAIVPTIFYHGGLAFYFTKRGTVFKTKDKALRRAKFLTDKGYVVELETLEQKNSKQKT